MPTDRQGSHQGPGWKNKFIRYTGAESMFEPNPAVGVVPRDLAVLIVSYRAADKLASCLSSVTKQLPGCEIYIWDNSGPNYSDIRTLAEKWPAIHWHFSDSNIGFAAAVNRLAAKASTSDLLLLNPDALLLNPLESTIRELRRPGVAAAGPLDAELSAGSSSPAGAIKRKPWDTSYRRLTILNFFGGASGLEYRLRGTPFSYRYKAQPRDIDGFLSGSCLAISRAAWDTIGEFDEEFFLYQEEAEWQRRAINAGWTIRLADEIGMRHESKGTVAGDAVRTMRSEDLAFAGAVLMGERCFGTFIANLYLAWTCVLRKAKSLATGRPSINLDVVLTAGRTDADISVVPEAIKLSNAGRSVAVVSLGPLGNLPQQLPPSVRLLRRPWWCPSIGPHKAHYFAQMMGSTKQERNFVRLYRVTHRSMEYSSAASIVSSN